MPRKADCKYIVTVHFRSGKKPDGKIRVDHRMDAYGFAERVSDASDVKYAKVTHTCKGFEPQTVYRCERTNGKGSVKCRESNKPAQSLRGRCRDRRGRFKRC